MHLRLKEPFIDNLQKLNKAAKEAFPDKTIDFGNYQQVITDQYNSVRVFRNATLMAAMTMFFIMLMGLIGYTTDEVYRRSKEIAIRKVNGAEASMILELLSRDILYVAVPAVFIGTIAALDGTVHGTNSARLDCICVGTDWQSGNHSWLCSVEIMVDCE